MMFNFPFVLKKTYDAKVAASARFIEALQSSHDHWLDEAKGWEAKYKKAITDLAAARDEVASLKRAVENQRASIASFMPDALAMRRKRQMDRDRKAAKKEGV